MSGNEDEEALAALEFEIANMSDELNKPLSSDATIRALKAKLAELEKGREAEKATRYDLRRKQQAAISELEQVKLRVRIRQENELQAARLAEQFAAMDEFTRDAVWRTGTKQGYKLYAHQLYGAHFIASAKRCIIADGMGLGKTGESIAGLDMLGAEKIIIVCPGDVMSGFYREVKMWSPGRAVAMIGRKPKEIQFHLLETLRDMKAEQFCLIINYEAWTRNKKILQMLSALQPDTVIIDEAHNIKTMTTSAFKGVKQLVHAKNVCPDVRCRGIVIDEKCTECWNWCEGIMSVENVICMTGTPILNKPGDIFPLLNLINPDIYTNKTYFLMEFCYNVGNDDWVWKTGGASALAAKLQGFYLRRTIEDTDVVLPPQDLQIHELEIDEEDYPLQYKIMTDIHRDAQIMLKDAENEGKTVGMASILAAITRERQACVWPGGIVLHEKLVDEMGFPTGLVRDIPVGLDYQESLKLDYSVKLIEEMIEDGHRIVVFSQFKSALSELQRRLVGRGIRSVEYHGDTRPDVAERVKTNFDRARGESPEWDIVLAHYRKGGVGLNFTAATQMIILDGEWNPGKEDQAYGRINRIGQTEENTVHIIRILNSIDAWLADLVERKRITIENFDVENSTYSELRNLLMQ